MPHVDHSHVSPASARPSRIFLGAMLLLGFCTTLLGGLGFCNGLVFALEGKSATGKVLAFHQVASRNASIVGQVEVALPGHAPFRAEVDDTLGVQNWQVGGTVALRCAEIHGPGYMSCSADTSSYSHLFLPLLLIGVGCAVVWWSWRNIRKPSTR